MIFFLRRRASEFRPQWENSLSHSFNRVNVFSCYLMSLIYVGNSKCMERGGERKIRFESFCPHLAAVTINAITLLLFKCILCCLFPYQHIDSTGNAEYTLVGIHICIHPGCFDSHAGTCGFHHIHPHLCN